MDNEKIRKVVRKSFQEFIRDKKSTKQELEKALDAFDYWGLGFFINEFLDKYGVSKYLLLKIEKEQREKN